MWGDDIQMKKSFTTPSCEVIRFQFKDIVTSSNTCYCNVGGYDYGMGEDDDCIGKNNPECTCGLIDEANCV